MRRGRFTAMIGALALLGGCGGGGGSSGGGGSTSTPSSPSTPSTGTTCSLRDRQDWAAAQLREWYLFPELLPGSLSPEPYATVGDYIDALTATARAQNKDRYFTYLTSIAAENAYYSLGSSAGFGFRLFGDSTRQRVVVGEVFESTPALAAGIDRGTEILAIGTSSADLRSVASLYAAGGYDAVSAALGDSTAGVVRVLRVSDSRGTRDVSMTKADYALTPVSSRYGAQVIDDGGRKVGYVNLRTFISTADPALRDAFQRFRDQGVTDVIVDLRYNGGGLLSIAELFGDLLGGGRSTSDVFSYTSFRPEKSAENSTRLFQPKSQSIAPARIAFIGTGGTASASEVVINAFTPYFHTNAALIGTNTYGKPVGQIAIDRSQCDDRFRIIALATQNAARQGDYYNGLADRVEASCQATDDLTHALGSPQESSTRAALDFIAGRSCTRIATGQGPMALSTTPRQEPLTARNPTAAQREVPGLF